MSIAHIATIYLQRKFLKLDLKDLVQEYRFRTVTYATGCAV